MVVLKRYGRGAADTTDDCEFMDCDAIEKETYGSHAWNHEVFMDGLYRESSLVIFMSDTRCTSIRVYRKCIIVRLKLHDPRNLSAQHSKSD